MAAISNSRRAAAGIAFVVAGALILLWQVLALAAVGALGYWPTVLAYLAIAVGLVILAIGSVANLVARIALIVGAVGWFLLALQPLVPAISGGVHTFAALAAAVGGVVGAIVLYTGKEITNRSAIAFIVTTIVAAIILLAGVAGVALGTLGSILWIVFGLGLVITGVLFYRVQGSRRR
jgi:hypothetical protein